MSSILSGDTEESRAGSNVRDPVLRVVEVALEESDSGRSPGSQGRGIVRPFLLVDLRAAVDYLRGNRGSTTEVIERTAQEALRSETTEGRREGGRRNGDGRGTLSTLFLLGVVVGIGYALRRRSGSVGDLVEEATDRARSVADEAEMRSGEAARRTEAATEEVADRIEERGEAVADEAADRVRETGETAADRVQEGGETVAEDVERAADTAEEAEQKAEEAAGGGSNENDGEENEQ